MLIPNDWVAHVHKSGAFIQWLPRKEIHDKMLIHRSINIFVFHPDGRLLVQQRAANKRTFPLFWDISCSGHVDYEDHPNGDPHASAAAFLSAATREISEELGIETPLKEVGEFAPFDGVNIERSMLYTTMSSGPFTLQKSEVAQVRWVEPSDFATLETKTPLLKHVIRHVLKWGI